MAYNKIMSFENAAALHRQGEKGRREREAAELEEQAMSAHAEGKPHSPTHCRWCQAGLEPVIDQESENSNS